MEIAVTGGTAGVADSPTELQTTITNIPTGAMVYVDPWAASGPASNANLVLPVPVSPCYGTNCQTAGTPVLVADNSAGANPGPIQVVWAITQTNPSAIDSLTFHGLGCIHCPVRESAFHRSHDGMEQLLPVL